MTYDVTYPPPAAEPTATAGAAIVGQNPYEKGGLRSANRGANSLFAFKACQLVSDPWLTIGDPFFGDSYTKVHRYQVPNPWHTGVGDGVFKLDLYMDLERVDTGGTWTVDVTRGGAAFATFNLHGGSTADGPTFIGRVDVIDTLELISIEIELNTYSMTTQDNWVRGIYMFPTPSDVVVPVLPQNPDGRYNRDVLPQRDEIFVGNAPLTPRMLNELKALLKDVRGRPVVFATSTTDIDITTFDGDRQKAATVDATISTTNASDNHVYWTAIPYRMPRGATDLTLRFRIASTPGSASLKLSTSSGAEATASSPAVGWNEVTVTVAAGSSGVAFVRSRFMNLDSWVLYSERY